MTDHRCPKCGSDDVLMGNFVLECNACRWHYLNKYPCRTCGGPATSVMSGVYGCKDHPFTGAEVRRALAGFAAAVRANA